MEQEDKSGVETEENNITVKALFQKFEDYCLPKKNFIVERRRFFTRNQQHDEKIDAYTTQLRNLSSTCEFGDVKEGLILYKLFDGIQSSKLRDALLRKRADLTLKISIDTCRADEATNHEMKIIKQEIDVDAVQRKEAIMITEEKYNTQLEQQYQLKQTTRRNANTVESNTCRDNVQHLVKRAENVGKRITRRIVSMQE